MRTKYFITVLCIFLSSCSKHEQDVDAIDWQKEMHLYEQDGWKYQETLGTPGAADRFAYFDSETASTTEGTWIENGQEHEKQYKQDSQIFCFLTFVKPNGDAFKIVLSKDKIQHDKNEFNINPPEGP